AALSRQAAALGVGHTRHLSWAGLGAALLGGIVLWRRSRRLWLGLAGSFAASGVFFFVLLALPYDPFASAGIDLMRREVVERFFVAPELLLCFAAGLGCAAWTRWRPVASAGRGGMRRWGVALPILLPAFLLWRHFPDADASNRYYFRDLGENVLRTVPPEAIIFRRDSTAVFATWCLQQAEGMRPDVVVITPPEARGGQTREWYVRQVRRRRPEILAGAVEFNAIEARLRETFPPAADGAEHLVYAVCARNIGRRPVYFDEFVPPLADHLVPEGILYRLLAVPLSPAERVLALGLGAEVLERQYRYRGLYALEAVENDGACRRAIFTYSAAHASFAREYLSLARLDRALHHALEAVRMHSQWPPHHRLLASVYRALGDDEAAAEHEARDRALMPLFRNLLEPGS
ncbi:MAG: hypothetical protein HY719_12295, partial [Planctomycetes bacterium]|nr:hypothetical protein [Planctomycetota bacterium]